jgi:hypothetical protein
VVVNFDVFLGCVLDSLFHLGVVVSHCFRHVVRDFFLVVDLVEWTYLHGGFDYLQRLENERADQTTGATLTKANKSLFSHVAAVCERVHFRCAFLGVLGVSRNSRHYELIFLTTRAFNHSQTS